MTCRMLPRSRGGVALRAGGLTCWHGCPPASDSIDCALGPELGAIGRIRLVVAQRVVEQPRLHFERTDRNGEIISHRGHQLPDRLIDPVSRDGTRTVRLYSDEGFVDRSTAGVDRRLVRLDPGNRVPRQARV